SIGIRDGMVDKTYACLMDPHCGYEDAVVLVDEFANRLTNTLPSTIAFGLSSSTSYEVIRIFVTREDEFVGVGAMSAIVVDAVDN
nr:hypothetical protein [Tanacetum cinerariifolium]